MQLSLNSFHFIFILCLVFLTTFLLNQFAFLFSSPFTPTKEYIFGFNPFSFELIFPFINYFFIDRIKSLESFG